MRSSSYQNLARVAVSLILMTLASRAIATNSTSPDVLARRGTMGLGKGALTPIVKLTYPDGGWTTDRMLRVAGSCSDPTATPLVVSINGSRYYVRSADGTFARTFPAAAGRNNVSVECTSAGGTGKAERVVTAAISPVRLKFVLTSDTDNVYTDLHIYEPSGAHVYWAETHSPTGGLFFLNEDGGFDVPGYGPYLYVHPTPPVGVFRVDVNYWPGGVVQHTLANLEIVIDEGLPTESRRRVQKPLAMPGETQTLAMVTILPNRAPPKIYVPGQDPISELPKDAPKPVEQSGSGTGDDMEGADAGPFLEQEDADRLGEAVSALALAQARHLTPAWDPGQRDCAGLVRFAYREGLQERTPAQRARLGLPRQLAVPPVSRRGRALAGKGGKLWQTAKGMAAFADAETLVARNFRRVSRSLDLARPGDLLVFRKEGSVADPYHLMMYAGGGRGREVVVYHNGARGKEAEVRVVSIRDLVEAPEFAWRPIAENPRFLGVYQWNRLRPAPGAS